MEVNEMDPKEKGHGTAFGLGPVEVYYEQSNTSPDSNIAGNLLTSWIIISLYF
jgi:hypothetical protein